MAHYLEKFYPWVPVWVQNLGISLYGLAWRHERLGGDFKQHVAGFAEREGWSGPQMEAYVNQELRRVLLRAFEQAPYYSRVWQSAGLTRDQLARMSVLDLPRLPITPKEDLRENPDLLVGRDVLARERLHRYCSSGSTGTPITAICTAEDHRRFIAAREVRSWRWAGTSIHSPRAMIGGRMVVPKAIAEPPFHRYNWAEKQVYFSAYHIAPSHVSAYVAAFNQYRPQLLTGYANSYYLLARMMNDQGIKLAYQPAALVLTSEKLSTDMKAVIQEAFRARAFEEYGAVENCVLATECEQGRLHVSPDFGVLEIVNDQGEPVEAGREGRILCTGLLNEAQFLIRYDIGDIGIWSPEPCPCGRTHLPVLQEIVGRLEDVVVGPDGRELVRFHGIFIGLPHVAEGQVIQETLDTFTVKLVTKTGYGMEEDALIRRRFAERLGRVQVAIQVVTAIPRTERGKFRAVISKVRRAKTPLLPAGPVEATVQPVCSGVSATAWQQAASPGVSEPAEDPLAVQ